MRFSVDNFRTANTHYPRVFSMKGAVDQSIYHKLEDAWKKRCVGESAIFDKMKNRVSIDYFNDFRAAQTTAISYSEFVFPGYKFLLQEVLMDDWLSIMDPHTKGKRDHSFHQPLTAYIVSSLLGNGDSSQGLKVGSISLLHLLAKQFVNSPKTKYLRDYFLSLYPKGLPPEAVRQSWAEAVFYQTALVAALFHDIGYPWQYVIKISRGVDVAGLSDIKQIGLSTNKLLEMISDRLLIYPFFGYSDTSRKRPVSVWKDELLQLMNKAFYSTHGFPGALAFTYLNDVLRVFPYDMSWNVAVARFIQDWAAVGILMHDMPKIYKGNGNRPEYPFLRLYADTDPLSCLIALADILEEFGRPSSKFTAYRKGIITRFEQPCEYTEINVKDNILEIVYKYETKTFAAKNITWRQEEVNDYFNDINGYIDLSAIGIEKVTCKVI